MQDFGKINGFKNAYCDALGTCLNEFIDARAIEDENDILNALTDEEMTKIIEYAIIKNKIAGVKELSLKVPKAGLCGQLFDKYDICGKEILSARLIDSLSAKDFVGGRIIIEVESILEYSEDYLSKIVDFVATTETPVIVKIGQNLEEVGKIVNKYKMSPCEVLESFGFFDRKCMLYGLNFFDKDDQKLAKSYSPTLIFSPKDDGEEGRGAINLYNIVFNEFDFCFASGKCAEIDMLLEGKLSIINTANLMHERGLISVPQVLNALQSKEGDTLFEKGEFLIEDAILDKKFQFKDESLEEKLLELRNCIKCLFKGGNLERF